MYSNCCCSCSFEPEIIKIGQSSHKIYSINILIFEESLIILNACTKSLETYWIHHVCVCFQLFSFIWESFWHEVLLMGIKWDFNLLVFVVWMVFNYSYFCIYIYIYICVCVCVCVYVYFRLCVCTLHVFLNLGLNLSIKFLSFIWSSV